eukprot:TRINITY_DN61205_c0_g1_i1.p1 TRINITY_DN61205_c0_g1~~TRINITY_DN61205_c0_g1_i1.p1  ORF type:complete len:509 (-),score=100.49 TRINITY_DN61205_c0_g1_i1:16-1323(-)
MVEDNLNDDMTRGLQDSQGRYILEGPQNKHAFALLVECVRQGGSLPASEMAKRSQELDLEARIEACKFVDYYLLPGLAKMQLTKELLARLVQAEGLPPKVIELDKLGLCRSEMIMDQINLEGLCIKNLRLENSHVRRIDIKRCQLLDCDLSMTVTAGEVRLCSTRMENVHFGVFTMKALVENGSHLLNCNLRVVEELVVADSELDNCTFKGSDEDRKDRQIISAIFRNSQLHGDVTLPFDKIVCEQTYFQGRLMRMTKGRSSISISKARLRTLPRFDSEGKIDLCLEDCDLMESLAFEKMRLHFRGVRCTKPCEFREVEFASKVCDMIFPRSCTFRNVSFKDGLQDCIASGCRFECCNLGYGQDAVADCLITECQFQSCRFPFLEDTSPVANFAGSNFVACRIQWSGQFAHEENFVINSHWLRKWNLAGCTVSEG